jgi:dihydropteroate synthase
MLRLGRGSFDDDALLIMAIINRTPDSFYDKGATYEFDLALDRVRHVVAEGADLVDIGGVKAAPGTEVTVAEEIDRTVSLVAAIRSEFP